jgi:hypothetical protein
MHKKSLYLSSHEEKNRSTIGELKILVFSWVLLCERYAQGSIPQARRGIPSSKIKVKSSKRRQYYADL